MSWNDENSFGDPAQDPRPPRKAPDLDPRPPLKDPYLDWEGGHPLQTIWFQPRRTVRRAVHRGSEWVLFLIVAMTGVGEFWDRASERNLGDRIPFESILVMGVLLGPLAGILGLVVGAALIRWTGRWLGGRGDSNEIRTALALGSIPQMIAVLLWIPYLTLLGREMFTEEMPTLDANPQLVWVLLGLSVAEIGLLLWTLFSISHGIAEVQGYRSAWKGFLNTILPGLILLGGLLAVGLVAMIVAFGLGGGLGSLAVPLR